MKTKVKNNIEIIFNHLNKIKKEESFRDIWNSVVDKIDLHGKDQNKIVAEVYGDMVLDSRFALSKNGNWTLRNFIKTTDLKRQDSFSDSFENTEEFNFKEMNEEIANTEKEGIQITEDEDEEGKIKLDDLDDLK